MIYRGSVLKVYNKSIIIMTEDNTFQRIKKFQGLEEGMEVYFEKEDIIKKKVQSIKGISAVAAAIFLLVVTSIYGINFWSTNYQAIALVSVDINPSVEIEINKNLQVIKALPVNKDALNLPLKDLKNKSLVDALRELVSMAENRGYIKPREKSYMLLTAVNLKESSIDHKSLEKILIEGKEKIENNFNSKNQDIEVITIESNKARLNEARKDQVSVGKMEMYKNTQGAQVDSETLEIQEINNKSVKELIEKTKKDHPVFEEHPSNNKNKDRKEEKNHPIFEEHPSKNKNKDRKEEKEHPVFKEHPKNSKDKDRKEKTINPKNNKKDHPVFKEHPRDSKKKEGKR